MRRHAILLALFVLAGGPSTSAAEEPAPRRAPLPEAMPEAQRVFFDEGPALLLPPAERDRLLALDEATRGAAIAELLARDPVPETPDNELATGIARRRRLVFVERLSFADDRSRLLFLRGAPAERQEVDCGHAFKPLEIWRYGPSEARQSLVLYRPRVGAAYRLWRPSDSKRALYVPEMEYWLEQWEEVKGLFAPARIDRQVCKAAKQVDEATGVDGLFGFHGGRPTDAGTARTLTPPADLAVWARAAATTPLPLAIELPLTSVETLFPAWRGQRIVTRWLLVVPPEAQLVPAVDGSKRELRLIVAGLVERAGEPFEEFRDRFLLPPPGSPRPIALVVERPLRPGERFTVHLRVTDEIGGGEALVTRVFRVPTEPQPVVEPPVPEDVIVALGEQLAEARIGGRDSLLLMPPVDEVVFGRWRADALVTGERIVKATFFLNGQAQLSRTAPPWTAEVRLPGLPAEWVVRVEGYAADGTLVAADEVVLNQPQGAPKVTILAPGRGDKATGKTLARAGVVVPEGRHVARVEFRLNEELVTTLERPPWETEIVVPPLGEPAFLAVAAFYDDGARVEDVRYLNVPKNLSELEVNLVELYTSVTDKSGRPIEGLEVGDFTVLDEGKPQKIDKFERVRDLPLTLGIVLDTSGSMQVSMAEAKRAAKDFLDSILTPRDRCFAVAFSDKPVLLMSPTSDLGALQAAIDPQTAHGNTALHDALLVSLYYFRGVAGKKALVLLSDGDDTSSAAPYRDALEYARRSGVSIYTIGLHVPLTNIEVRRHLRQLAEETGGQNYMIDKAVELAGTYKQIERELRSQYLLAFLPDPAPPSGKYRLVEVQIKDGKLKARTMRGYLP